MSIFGKGSEAGFLFAIKGAPATEVVSFEAGERLMEPFTVDVNLAGPTEIQYAKVMAQEALLTITAQGADRYFHGIVTKFEHTGKVGSTPLSYQYLYTARMVPFTQLLSLEQDCRIFQNKNVQDIIADIFKDSNIPSDRYDFRLKNKDHQRRYCVQYRETDLDFINRILQEEGIFYFYEHSKDKHIMVFADDPVGYKPIAGDTNITFKPAGGLTPEKEAISDINFSRRLCSGAYTQTNYNFKHPSALMETKEKSKDHNIQKYEIYDYPGQYGEQGRGKKLTKVKMEEQTAFQEQAQGISNCPRLMTGHTFKLNNHDFKAFNKEYLLVEVTHSGRQPQTLEEQAGTDGGTTYSNDFTAIPSSVSYHPLKTIEKPYIKGIQSAAVVGPPNEEIYVDEHGRVKVRFHWDRKGKKDEQSSCWLRCAQTWGGQGWGAVFIPRIGDEVIIDFIEGDPDWPIIVGSVYNAANPPLYDLPNNKTRSTIKTKSYPHSRGFNELRFEDKAGNEEIYLQGEKDWNILIKNDKTQNVGHDETLNIANNRTKKVSIDQREAIGDNKTITVGNNHTETIGANMTLSTGANKTDTTAINSAETVGAAKELTIGGLYQISVGGIMNETVAGAKTEEVGGISAVIVGSHMTQQVKGNRTEEIHEHIIIKGDKIHIQADNGIITETGSAGINMASGGNIVITGTNIQINGDGNIKFKGSNVAFTGPAAAASSTLKFDESKQYDEQFHLVDADGETPLPYRQYRITASNGQTWEGTSDADGLTMRVCTQTEVELSIEIFDDEEDESKVIE